MVKRRRVTNNNTDYEYDLDGIKQPKKARIKPAEKSLEKDQAFYVRIFEDLQFFTDLILGLGFLKF